MSKVAGQNNPNYKHGGTFNFKKEYNSWRAMRARCYYKKYRYYERYGGRGIKCCSRWDNFQNFLEDMGPRPDGCTLDRIDNNGDYCPENCRWSNQSTQVKNSQKVLLATVTKEEINASKCSVSLVYKRLREGWSKKDALAIEPEYSRQKFHEKVMAERRRCPICGKICSERKRKFCSSEHYRMYRFGIKKTLGGVGSVKSEEAV